MAVKKSELYSLLWEACNKLRGGVEPARYKDYVLVLLFFKYVSDRYKGQKFAEFTISKGASFEDLIEAKGKSDVGERADKIIQKFLEDNQLIGSLPDVSFNNADELGSGKELVDKVSGLIGVFQNPAIDFKNNRASGDDIIGDAYEYFMMKFAQESGKSKGQFYTPSEVSRIIARLIGIADIKESPNKKWTLYDPAAGSGSLLIRAADEAPVNANGDSIVTIFGQESDRATAGLAKMNLMGVKEEEIRLHILKKLPEITKTRNRMLSQLRQTKREYVSGEAHYIWGKPYRLQVIYERNKTKVEKTPNKLILTVSEGTSEENREKIITEWYRKELRRVLDSVVSRCEKRTGIHANEYRIKNMRTKWGTCNIDKRRIWINLQLAKKPI